MRYFTLDEAQRLIPEVERHVRDALFHKAEVQQASREMERTLDRVRVSGGARLDPARQRDLRTRREASVQALRKALGAIEETGALVKDLDIGLLDFMTRYRSQDVCLCWKLGEDAIRFWHGAEEGFRGRKQIDEEFRKNHHTGPDEGAPN
jgi:hypothetical protein